jgi:hypothetical protein
MFPVGFGFEQKVKTSQTMLTLVEVKTGIQQVIATGSARKKEISVLGGGLLNNAGVGALGGTHTSTDMGKITSLAMLDAFRKLTTQRDRGSHPRSLPPLPRQPRRQRPASLPVAPLS